MPRSRTQPTTQPREADAPRSPTLAQLSGVSRRVDEAHRDRHRIGYCATALMLLLGSLPAQNHHHGADEHGAAEHATDAKHHGEEAHGAASHAPHGDPHTHGAAATHAPNAGTEAHQGAATQRRAPRKALDAERARERLVAGNARFAVGDAPHAPPSPAERRALRDAAPFAAIVTTSDSRVPPERVFDAGLGELLVLRNAGGVCDDALVAGLEYAVEEYGIELAVVLTHEGCSTVRAAARTLPDPGAILPGRSDAYHALIAHLGAPLRRAAADGVLGEALLTRAEDENAYATIREVLARSSLLRERVRSGRLAIRGAKLRGDGTVTWLPPRPAELDPRPAPDRAPGRRAVRGLPPHVALDMLRAGHRRFLRGGRSRADVSIERREHLARDQARPFAAVLAGVDARTAPEVLFDAGLGDLWTVRSPGLSLTPEIVGSIEMAIQEQGTAIVAVLLDRRSPFVARALDPSARADQPDHLRRATAQLDPAIATARAEGRHGDELVARVVELHGLSLLRRLREASPVIREFEHAGLVGVLAAVTDSDTGDVSWLPDGTTVQGFVTGVRPEPFVPADPRDDGEWFADLEEHGAFAALRREIRDRQRGGPPVAMPEGLAASGHDSLDTFAANAPGDLHHGDDHADAHGEGSNESEGADGFGLVTVLIAGIVTAAGLFLLRRFTMPGPAARGEGNAAAGPQGAVDGAAAKPDAAEKGARPAANKPG
jgi:carbonic anhydrase